MALTKANLAENITSKLGLTRRESKDIVDSFFNEIKVALSRAEDVKISGLGNFIIKDKNERPGRNPKTGEFAVIAARRVVTFKAGQKLKTRLADITVTIN